ncbi:hypothetical protein KFL_004090040 [Klebsormidium nitens]|uniref:Uncharacterized protein n=1 Tax=Klebsormidium nitens TaxID=105231 RepID=A0A1Y1IE15_KLENI|nr:hypothetical protein KFL_004090040 [Klebsormidium nitens]|eukprot:GAQ88202.1 hypothetical protein KFL_004090040 [Klebsormidium nitens]
MANPGALQLADCVSWSQKYPNSTSVCLNKFHEFTAFSLGYICSLAAVPFGRGSRGAAFTNRQKIAQASWLMIVIALFLGLMRRRAFRYTQKSTAQILWEPLAFFAKLLAIAFAPLFGILVGDIDPNSNLLEVLVWILPGLLFHRYSPEIIEDNSLTGMLINTVTYVPGLLTAAFSLWSAGDFSLLAPEEVWTTRHYLHDHSASLAIRVLASMTIAVAFLRQTFGAYTNLVLATKRQQLDYDLGRVNKNRRLRKDRRKRQEERDRIMQTLYNTNGLPRLSVDLDWHSFKNHVVLATVEALTFIPIGVFVIWTTTFVRGVSSCSLKDSQAAPPSFFTCQALACNTRDFSCDRIAQDTPTLLEKEFCDSPSFNVAIFTGYLTVAFTAASFLWLFVQAWAVYQNHTDESRPACNKRLPEEVRGEFVNQVQHLLGTFHSRRSMGAHFFVPFLILSIWWPPRSLRTGANHVADLENPDTSDATDADSEVEHSDGEDLVEVEMQETNTSGK